MDERNEELNKEIKNYYENENFSKRKNKKGGKGILFLALIFSLIGGLLGSALTYGLLGERFKMAVSTEANKEKDFQSQNVNIQTSSGGNSATYVFEKVVPSVVGITTQGYQMTPFGTQAVRGTGSGVIYSDDGYILTNSHVVSLGGKTAEKVNVFLNDGTSTEGKVVWSDSFIDIALVKIKSDKKLEGASFGDSDTLKVGQTAIAIGNPLDMAFQRSMSKGIISGLNRYIGQVDGGGFMVGLIQTDASINGGNSGGPLINDRGQVIGINTVKVSSAEGMGFAIPINSIKPIIESVIKTGDYKAVALGASSVPVEAANRMLGTNIKSNKGLYVGDVLDNSPAKAAGLEKGDVLLRMDGKDLDSVNTLRADLYKYKPGDKVKLDILRDKKEMTLEITFTDYKVPKTEENVEKNPNNQDDSQMDDRERQRLYEFFKEFFGR